MSYKQKIGFSSRLIIVSSAIFLCLSIWGKAFAYDAIDHVEPPPFSKTPEISIGTHSTGESVWHVDVNSGCSYSDHNIYLNIETGPDKIKDAKIKLTSYDVDYNDPQGCTGTSRRK